MVKENRIVFEIQDIHKVRFTCKNCQKGLIYSLSKKDLDGFYLLENCPHCQNKWRENPVVMGPNTVWQLVMDLMNSIRTLSVAPDRSPFTIQFEMKDGERNRSE